MPQDPLRIEGPRRDPGGRTYHPPRGTITIFNFFEFQSTVRADTSHRLILDLDSGPYIDSAGIGALVGAYVSHQKTAGAWR